MSYATDLFVWGFKNGFALSSNIWLSSPWNRYVFVVSRFFIWTYGRKQVFNWPKNSKNYYATQFLFVNYQVLKERASESNFLGDANNLQFDPFGKQLFFSKPKICSKYILKKVSNGCYPHQSSNAKCIYIKLPFN